MTVWEDPPTASRSGVSVWPDRLAPLMDNPGEWARFDMGSGNTASTAASRLRDGTHKLPEGTTPEEWEFTSRRHEDGSSVYARYVGPQEQEKKPVRKSTRRKRA